MTTFPAHDPHAVLGAHPDPDRKGVVIRAWAPEAEAVTVVLDDRRVPMQAVGAAGMFEARLRRTTVPRYRFAVRWPAAELELEDPYRFLPSIGALDLHLIGEGSHERLWEALGAHPRALDGIEGTAFALWAPGARAVSVVGDWNLWDARMHPLRSLGSSGVWELFVPGVGAGTRYKFAIVGADGRGVLHADPLAREAEQAPATASIVAAPSGHRWGDAAWLADRGSRQSTSAPVTVYEVHLGSWRPGLSYRELAETLPEYVAELGFTHVELLPVMHHPFEGSWGYQVTGYFAPWARLGSPDDLRALIDAFHQRGIGVLLDWVPAHFPRDAWALAELDGTALYEHADPRRGAHPDWGTLIFNYGRREVENFLVADALYWLDEFHADGLRVDAVASMLYLDYSREADEWLPNVQGGNENLEAIAFLQRLNRDVYRLYPGVMTVAEESTAWPGVTAMTDVGGLGFGFKWNMGWMHDTLVYFGHDPIHRRWHHEELTRPLLWGFSENYLLPISHDEVVHGKGSLLTRMPGDDWQRFANVRALLAWMWAHPGKKLLFMGQEWAQRNEWRQERGLDWQELEHEPHAGVRALTRDLNLRLRDQPALFRRDTDPGSFRWLVVDDRQGNCFAYLRSDGDGGWVACIANLSPVVREGYEIALPAAGRWRELINTDATAYWGSGIGNRGGVEAIAEPLDGLPARVRLTVPPLAVLWLAPEG